MTYTVRATAGAGETLANQNLVPAGQMSPSNNGLGTLATDSLQFQQSGATTGQTVTFTFSKPVSNLTFSVADLDNSGTLYQDRVSFSPAPTSSVLGANVAGVGSSADPLRGTGTSAVNSDVTASWAKVSFAGPLTTLTMTFRSQQGTSPQQIFITAMSFTAAGC